MALSSADALGRLNALEGQLTAVLEVPPAEQAAAAAAAVDAADHLAGELHDSPSPYLRAVAELHRAGARAQLLLLGDPAATNSPAMVVAAADAALDASQASPSPNVRGEVAMGVISVLATAASVLGELTSPVLGRAEHAVREAAEAGGQVRAEGLTEMGVARGLLAVADEAGAADRDVIVAAARARLDRAAGLFARSGDVELYRAARS
jgi:hypothetical protein